MGFVMLGLFSGTRSGIEGALLQMINHGISTGALFLLVGVIYDRRHTREVREFGGLAKVMPIYAAIFIIVTMSSIGVPGTNGFVGELMIVLGTFVSLPLGSHGQIQATLAMTGVILAAVYMLSVVQKMFFGPLANPKNKNLPDLNVRETVALAPLVALIFVIGLFPGIILDRMKDGVSTVLDNYTSGKKAYDELGPEATQPVLRPRKGGPLETGYPEPPKPEGASEEAPPDETKTAELGVQPPTMPPPGGEVPAPAPRPVQPGHEGHGHP
jgi:NADH-quinone oxidoreductase subunit M